MIDNDVLKARIKKQLKKLKLTNEQEDQLVKELNYLSNLLIDIYIKESETHFGKQKLMGSFGESERTNE